MKTSTLSRIALACDLFPAISSFHLLVPHPDTIIKGNMNLLELLIVSFDPKDLESVGYIIDFMNFTGVLFLLDDDDTYVDLD